MSIPSLSNLEYLSQRQREYNSFISKLNIPDNPSQSPDTDNGQYSYADLFNSIEADKKKKKALRKSKRRNKKKK